MGRWCSGTGRRRKRLLKVESGKMKVERPALEESGAGFSFHYLCLYRATQMRKQQVLDSIAELPEEFLAEDLIERIIFMEKVEKGLKDAREGRTISLEEARIRLAAKWQK